MGRVKAIKAKPITIKPRPPGKAKGLKTPHHGIDVREALRAHFVANESASVRECAEKFNVSLRSAARWKAVDLKAGDCWERARRARGLTRAGEETIAANVLTRTTAIFDQLLEQIKDDKSLTPAQQLDLYSKAVMTQQRAISAVRRLAPTLNKFSVATEVMELFAKFIAEKMPGQAAVLVPAIRQFGPYLNLHMGRDNGVRG